MSYSAPKGTRDILPQEIREWQALELAFREVAEHFAFHEIRTPAFESTEVFQRGVGDGTDIVQKEMYTFLDKGGRSMTLRPEGTAGVVRAFIQRGLASTPFPVKLYYLMNLFRYENVQEGRYREFHQLGLEAFGAEGPEIDAEIIALLQVFFDRIGLRETNLRINSIGNSDSRGRYMEVLRDYYRPHLDELCPDCRQRFERNPLRLLDCKEPACHMLAAKAPLLRDYLDEESQAHFEGLCAELDRLGIHYVIEPRLVRGLDYYTQTVFEYVSEHVGTQGTICGGGRYNHLVSELGGAAVPACGFALGEERLLKELEAQGIQLTKARQTGLFIASRGDEAAGAARALAYGLRRGGLRCETELCGRSFKGQMKFAGKSDFTHLLVLGEDELKNGEARIKALATGEQQDCRCDTQSILNYFAEYESAHAGEN